MTPKMFQPQTVYLQSECFLCYLACWICEDKLFLRQAKGLERAAFKSLSKDNSLKRTMSVNCLQDAGYKPLWESEALSSVPSPQSPIPWLCAAQSLWNSAGVLMLLRTNVYWLQIGSHQIPTWWTNEFYCSCLEEYGWGATQLLTGVEMIQRQLHHQSPSQHRGQLTKAGNLEHSACSAAAQQVVVSFPGR